MWRGETQTESESEEKEEKAEEEKAKEEKAEEEKAGKEGHYAMWLADSTATQSDTVRHKQTQDTQAEILRK